MNKLEDIISNFGIEAADATFIPLRNGLINDTYKVSVKGSDTEYVLQRINKNVFSNVDLLQNNIDVATNHLRSKLRELGESEIDRKCLRFLRNVSDRHSYVEADGEYWRMRLFVRDSYTKDDLNPENAYMCGLAFGEFEKNLNEVTPLIGETIPHFHDMEYRVRQFREALASDAAGRVKEVPYLIEKVLSFTEEMTLLERLHRKGILPKRVCHCDAKLNNILFDADGDMLCIIDLDTVMPSFIFSDFGDFLRSAANTGSEDSENLAEVDFDLDIFRSFAKGYLTSASFLTPLEKALLPFAARLFPYMQAVRFLTDYINGDTYYKIRYPEHNLVRTKAQLKLFDRATEKEVAMTEIINDLCK